MTTWELSQKEREKTFELLRDLVAQPTINPPGNEENAAQVLEAFFRAHDLSVERYEVEPGRPNLLCKVEGRRAGRSILLTSHMDVVAPGRLDLWTHDPFEPYIEEGRLYGRGSCDAKASLAAMATAVVRLARDRQFDGRVLFGAAMGEEITGIGSQRMAETGHIGDAVVVGEPTNLQVMTAHKGRVEVHLEVPGRAAHASQPHRSINPIPRAANVIQRLTPFCKEVSRRTHPLLGTSSFVFTILHAGEKQNVIPDSCRIGMDYRVVPPWTQEQVMEELEDVMKRLSQELGYEIRSTYRPLGRPASTPLEEPIVQAALKAVQSNGIDQEAPTGFTACCDMHHFRAVGAPTIILGPGRLEQAHTTDEFVGIEQVIRGAQIYHDLALEFLSQEPRITPIFANNTALGA